MFSRHKTISGSTTGLGLMAGELLASQGHRVVLHARNADRAEDGRRALPKAGAVVVGDVETIAGVKDLASQANALGRFDAVIHNAAVGCQPRRHLWKKHCWNGSSAYDQTTRTPSGGQAQREIPKP
jgi:NAD(P)-dependent dehydrogenase (short-subunit alcohol dehydrogenase family)